MGCSGSKAEDLPLVVRCRERRELVRAAANHRYALAAAHVSYFRSLKDVGEALRKYVDEELVTASPSSSSSVSPPSLTMPPSSKKKCNNADKPSLRLHDDEVEEESHLHLSDSTSEDSDSEAHKNQHHYDYESEDDTRQHNEHATHVQKGKGLDNRVRHSQSEVESSSRYPRGGFNGYSDGLGDGFVNYPYLNPYSYPTARAYGEPYMDRWGPQGEPPSAQPWYYSSNSSVYYLKSAPATRTVVQELPSVPAYRYSDSYWTSPASYGGNYGYFSMNSPVRMGNNEGVKVNPQKEAPPPPSPPKAWDFFNLFDVFDNGYPSYYPTGGYGYGSYNSSPDSSEVREREGIPDLEEETENEVYKEVVDGNRMKAEARKGSGHRAVPVHKNSNGNSRSMPSWGCEESEKPSMPPQHNGESAKKSSMPLRYSEEKAKPSVSPPHRKVNSWMDQSANGEMTSSISLTDEKSSPESMVLKGVDKRSVKKKGVTFEVEGTSKQDAGSSKLNGIVLPSSHGTRDLREVVAEIRDEFETASSYGKEVATMLEVGKQPYQPSFLKAIVSRILYLISPSLSLWDPPSTQSTKSSSTSMKSAKSYFEDAGKDVNPKVCNLSSTLDKLHAWEKKLYKEVKEEERLRVLYEKQCKKLKDLDEAGAESSKVDATRASIRKLLTKLDVSIKAIDAISSRIHKLRDEELQPQVAALIFGLIRMWKAMLKCHQKQFQAIMESKMRKLRANGGLQADSSSRASTELERELRAWCECFNDWVAFQKSYVESLNGWLRQCLQYEPEDTPDGPAPYSPGRLGAPPIFIICNDWHQAMEAISEARVANAMNTFATSLRQLWEEQDEEGRRRLKVEYLSKDHEKQLRARRMVKGKMEHELDSVSDKTGLYVVPSGNGVSPLDDLKVDLDSMKHKLAKDRVEHKDAMKLVHDAAASSSLQGGLVPIFEALENFTSEALKAHEHVRLGHPGKSV